MSSQFFNDSIFWIEVDKIHPNPFQPRKEFDQARLNDLAESIRMYGVLQPLVVTRKEVIKDDGGIVSEYELIAGERRLRASKIAGLSQVPALIRASEDDDRTKLEIAIIENLQREDLNVVDRARAFQRLIDEFKFKHCEIAAKVGKSREYVSNTLRVLLLPPEMVQALSEGKMTEGHTRPLLMLIDRPEEQKTLFKEIIFKKMNVRQAEMIARKIAYERVRSANRSFVPELVEMEEKLQEALGTRVHIEAKEKGGKILIDFFSAEDLRNILSLVKSNQARKSTELLDRVIETGDYIQNDIEKNKKPVEEIVTEELSKSKSGLKKLEMAGGESAVPLSSVIGNEEGPIDDRTPEEIKIEENEDIYSVKNFTV